MTSIHIRSTFLPGTTVPMTQQEIADAIASRQAVIRQYRNHDVVKALGEMLDLQAVRHTALALEADCPNREQAVGASNAVSYVAGVLHQILHQPEEDKSGPQE